MSHPLRMFKHFLPIFREAQVLEDGTFVPDMAATQRNWLQAGNGRHLFISLANQAGCGDVFAGPNNGNAHARTQAMGWMRRYFSNSIIGERILNRPSMIDKHPHVLFKAIEEKIMRVDTARSQAQRAADLRTYTLKCGQ